MVMQAVTVYFFITLVTLIEGSLSMFVANFPRLLCLSMIQSGLSLMTNQPELMTNQPEGPASNRGAERDEAGGQEDKSCPTDPPIC